VSARVCGLRFDMRRADEHALVRVAVIGVASVHMDLATCTGWRADNHCGKCVVLEGLSVSGSRAGDSMRLSD
jgi:hypothetical protein